MAAKKTVAKKVGKTSTKAKVGKVARAKDGKVLGDRRPGKLSAVKVKDVQKLLKGGMTIGMVAKKFGCARFSLYQKFGDAIKGISGKGNRVA